MIERVFAQQVLPPIDPGDITARPGQRIFEDLGELVLFAIRNLLLPILAGLAVLYVVWSGYQFITSGSDPARAEKARANLTYSIIGVLLIMIAYALVGGLNTLIRAISG